MTDKPRKRKRAKAEYRMRTHLIHGNYESKKWDYNHHVVPPMSSSATYRLSSAQRGAQGFFEFASEHTDFIKHVPIYIYDRLEEPTRGMLEENLAYAEGGEMCVTFASGMAAISATLGMLCEAGHEIVAHQILYGCTYSLMTNWLPRYQVNTRFVNLQNLEELRRALSPKTRVVYFETPVNPDLSLIDIAAVRRVVDEVNRDRAPERQIKIVVDNTFATPFCQRPIALGADFSVHSLTKDIGGFGTDMGGAVIGPQRFYSPLLLYRKDFGGVLSPKSAWAILVYGLPTLSTRMINQQKTACKVARFLQEHPKVARVVYPGLESHPQFELAKRQMVDYEGKFAPGAMIYFVLKGNDARQAGSRGEAFIDYIADHAYSITLAVSLGQIKTLIESPYSMTHSALPEEEKRKRGMEPGGIRLAIGLEDWHDVIEDLREALEQV
ncbi:MAG: PLP-dependent aspartate aminotransferase family protein [candidate division KSB1 bacterium]|nr:PLP-dependent aspartate aminotransferase family protein [candidate division KSB1 bacterium]MDZ7276296.1 PLP-dependent aspartate aminotransferase family protein [candidate division KSB1 bacterium]MDZ7287751.1 PLP-dependent aspartate aminotransferase family protein [candidate division KSB1 bacterium]MDZ7299909.1 PLP-dependent aspartate aminotransferase family protein [candidate division KSB1 bacterium]MDZ7308369.1 PLP-dependent aspartate aminotransferase family protein [candidate division KSB1